MDKKGDLLIHIDAYLRGYLSDAEKKAFEQNMAADAALAKRVQQQRLHLEALEILLADDLTSKMQKWETETMPNNLNPLKGWGLGFLGIVLLGALYIFMKPAKETISPSLQNNNSQDTSPHYNLLQPD